MAEVQRLVGVRRRELDHDVLAGRRQVTEVLVSHDLSEKFVPEEIGEQKVKETFDAVIFRDFRYVRLQPFSDGVARVLRSGVRQTQEREDDEREVSGEFLPCDGDLKRRRFDVGVIECLDGF